MPKRQFKAIVGIDEVARCPVIGSLVLAGVAVEKGFDLNKFRRLGVKDSKGLSKTKIQEIARKLYTMKGVMVKHRKISGKIISKSDNINTLEAQYAATLVKAFKECTTVHSVFIDSCDRDSELYKKRLNRFIRMDDYVKYTIETKADQKYLIVSAASIVAKYISDKEYEMLRMEHEIGSGNPNDEKTLGFLIECIMNNRKPDFIRTSWITYRRLYDALHNKEPIVDPYVIQIFKNYFNTLKSENRNSEASEFRKRLVNKIQVGGKKNGFF